MRDFLSCSCESGVQISDHSFCTTIDVSKPSQDLVTCIHHCNLLGKPCLISIIWSKNNMVHMNHGFSIEVHDSSHQFQCRLDVKPSLFSKRKGSNYFHVYSTKVNIFWDFSLAKYGSGPEPLEGYYIALVCKKEMVLVVGNLKQKAFKKVKAMPYVSNPILISKREHLFGNRVYSTKAQFYEDDHVYDLKIECRIDGNDDDDSWLVIRLDGKTVMKVKHLRWKFRGNYTVLADGGEPVEVFWDVFNWLFGTTCFGNAVFVFQAEKLWKIQTFPDVSILSWPQSNCLEDDKVPCQGFTLVLNVLNRE